MSDTNTNTNGQAPPKAAVALTSGNRPTGIVPTDFDGVWRIATVLYNSGMVAKDFIVRPVLHEGETAPSAESLRLADNASLAKISVALMHGLEIGLPPMQAIQKIAIINGRPTVWGDAVIGLVWASGLPEFIEEIYVGAEGTDDYKAVCRTKRKNASKVIEAEFSVRDAKKARLWDERPTVTRFNKTVHNDSPWYKYPKRMLKMRARVALRDAYADVLGGLYIAEEMIEGDDAVDVTPPEAQPAPRKAPPPPAQVIEHKVDDETVKPAEATATADELDIPPALRRAPAPKVEPLNEEHWLSGVEAAYSGCEDLDSLNEEMIRLVEPMMERVSELAWDRAGKLYEDAVARVTNQ